MMTSFRKLFSLCLLTVFIISSYLPTQIVEGAYNPLSISITSPTQTTYVTRGKNLTISWKGSDSSGKSCTVRLWIKDQTSKQITIYETSQKSGSYTWTVPTTTQTGGFTLYATIKNSSGYAKTAIGSSIVIRANTQPVINVSQPSSNKSVTQGDTVGIQWNVTDADNDSLTVAIIYKDIDTNTSVQTLKSNVAATGSFNWDTNSIPPGTYVVGIRANDGAGNNLGYAAGNIKINDLAPQITGTNIDNALLKVGDSKQIEIYGKNFRNISHVTITCLYDQDGSPVSTIDTIKIYIPEIKICASPIKIQVWKNTPNGNPLASNLYNTNATVATPKPDIQPKEITAWNGKAIKAYQNTINGKKITFVDIAVQNTSNVSISQNFTVTLYLDGASYRTASVFGGIPANNYKQVEGTNFGELNAGCHTFAMKIDRENIIPETNETNNEYSISQCFEEEKPDLEFKNIPTWGNTPYKIREEKTYANQLPYVFLDMALFNTSGKNVTGDFHISIDLDNKPFKTVPVFGGVSSNTTKLIDSNNALGQIVRGCHTFKLKIDSNNVVNEKNEGNNELSFQKCFDSINNPEIPTPEVPTPEVPQGEAAYIEIMPTLMNLLNNLKTEIEKNSGGSISQSQITSWQTAYEQILKLFNENREKEKQILLNKGIAEAKINERMSDISNTLIFIKTVLDSLAGNPNLAEIEKVIDQKTVIIGNDVVPENVGITELEGKSEVRLYDILTSESIPDEPFYSSGKPEVADYKEDAKEIIIEQRIRSKALELGHNPVAIYNFVKNEIDFELYNGAKKGSVGCLIEKRCNDVDSASLLISLLRASGIPARYVEGKTFRSATELQGLLKTNNNQIVAQIFKDNEREIKAVLKSGTSEEWKNIDFFITNWVWVEAFVHYDYTHGESEISVSSDKQSYILHWVPLVPTFKTYSLPQNTPFNFDTEQFWNEYISTASAESPLQIILKKLSPASIEISVLSVHTEKTLPLSLPFLGQNNLNRLSSIPDAKRSQLTLSILKRANNETVFQKALFMSEIAGRNILLRYEGASEQDKTLINEYGSIYRTPPAFVQIKPYVEIENGKLSGGTNLSLGTNLLLQISFTENGKLYQRNTPIFAGETKGIYIHFGGKSSPNIDSTDYSNIAKKYLQTVRDDGETFAALKSRSIQRFIGIAITGDNIHLGAFENKIQSIDFSGLNIDSTLFIQDYGNTLPTENSKDFHLLFGLNASFHEHDSLKNETYLTTISTVKGLQRGATQNGYSIKTIRQNNKEELNTLEIAETIKNFLKKEIAEGKKVITLNKNLTLQGWSGPVYVVLDSKGFGTYAVGEDLLNGGWTTNAMNILLSGDNCFIGSLKEYHKGAIIPISLDAEGKVLDYNVFVYTPQAIGIVDKKSWEAYLDMVKNKQCEKKIGFPINSKISNSWGENAYTFWNFSNGAIFEGAGYKNILLRSELEEKFNTYTRAGSVKNIAGNTIFMTYIAEGEDNSSLLKSQGAWLIYNPKNNKIYSVWKQIGDYNFLENFYRHGWPVSEPDAADFMYKQNFSAENSSIQKQLLRDLEKQNVALIASSALLSMGDSCSRFKDVSNDSWYCQYVRNAMREGWIDTKNDYLRPNDKVTRAEFAKMVIAAINARSYRDPSQLRYEVNNTLKENPFIDVNRAEWFAPYVETLKASGIISGYNDGSFKPANFINRPEAIKIITQAEAINVDTKTCLKQVIQAEYKDQWFANYIAAAYAADILNPLTFEPATELTRAQVIKIISRVFSELQEIDATDLKNISCDPKNVVFEGEILGTREIFGGEILLKVKNNWTDKKEGLITKKLYNAVNKEILERFAYIFDKQSGEEKQAEAMRNYLNNTLSDNAGYFVIHSYYRKIEKNLNIQYQAAELETYNYLMDFKDFFGELEQKYMSEREKIMSRWYTYSIGPFVMGDMGDMNRLDMWKINEIQEKYPRIRDNIIEMFSYMNFIQKYADEYQMVVTSRDGVENNIDEAFKYMKELDDYLGQGIHDYLTAKQQLENFKMTMNANRDVAAGILLFGVSLADLMLGDEVIVFQSYLQPRIQTLLNRFQTNLQTAQSRFPVIANFYQKQNISITWSQKFGTNVSSSELSEFKNIITTTNTRIINTLNNIGNNTSTEASQLGTAIMEKIIQEKSLQEKNIADIGKIFLDNGTIKPQTNANGTVSLYGIPYVRGSTIKNPLPNADIKDVTFVRIMNRSYADNFFNNKAPFSSPKSKDVFITAADDIKGYDTSTKALAERLSLYSDEAGTQLNMNGNAIIYFKFKNPEKVNLGTPFETIPGRGFGFKGGGYSKGGAREWRIDNGFKDELEIEVLNIKYLP